jgi:hypothetical protein
MRAYAFTGRNKATLGILCVCFGALFAVEVWFFCVDVPPIPTATYEILGETGCFPNYPNTTGNARLAVRHCLEYVVIADPFQIAMVRLPSTAWTESRRARASLKLTYQSASIFMDLVSLCVIFIVSIHFIASTMLLSNSDNSSIVDGRVPCGGH